MLTMGSDKQISIRIWGVRGSSPHPSEEYLRFGGNTSCISVETEAAFIVFDAGTGFSEFGRWYVRRGDFKPVHLFISHTHMDHILGLYQSPVCFNRNVRLFIYGEDKNGMSIEAQIGTAFSPHLWPVAPGMMQAHMEFVPVSQGDCLIMADPERHFIACGEAVHNRKIDACDGALPEKQACFRYESDRNAAGLDNSVIIKCVKGFHPGGSLLFRMEKNGRSAVYALDCELFSECAEEELTEAFAGADIIFADAAFDCSKIDAFRGWGHSSWMEWSQLRRKAGIGRAVMLHYAWDLDDGRLEKMEKEAASCDRSCTFAREGDEIWL